MAANLRMSDRMAEASAGEYLSDHHTLEAQSTLRAAQAVYELAVRQSPQAAVGLSHEGNPPMVYNSMEQRWPSSFGAHAADTSTLHRPQTLPVTEHGGHLHEGYGCVQSFRGEEVPSSGLPEDTTSRHGYQQNADNTSLDNDQRGELLSFPEGEADAVTITERDIEGLQPTRFLSNNIIDFYIKYLERTLLSSQDRNRFYFFNSFFFTKILGNNNASTDIEQCKVDYEQVRKWSGEVNLFEKDYVFVPVLRRSHWSLIIICHLTTVCGSAGKEKGSPCVFHLDSLEGKHESFEVQIRSYLLQAWTDRYQVANNMDQLHALFQMKYVQAQVPQQDNGYDCGLYLLHYVEVFLHESTSPNFSFASSKRGPHFARPHFAAEVSAKRMAIERLILELGRTSKEKAAKRMKIKNLCQELRRVSQKLLICMNSEVEQSNGVSTFNAQGDGSKDAVPLSTSEIAMNNQHQQCLAKIEHKDDPTTQKLSLDNIPPDGVEITYVEYQSTDEFALDKHQQPERLPGTVLPKPLIQGTNKRGRNWTEKETSILLNCMVEGGRFRKENQNATRWDIISQEIGIRHGTMPSPDQCRLRYDTLLKAYNISEDFCLKTGKLFSEISEKERDKLKLAKTLMREDWYNAIGEIRRRWPRKNKSQKRLKLSPSDGNGLLSLSPCNPAPRSPPAPTVAQSLAPAHESAPTPISKDKENSPQRQVAIPKFSVWNEELRPTFFHLIETLSLKGWRAHYWQYLGPPAVEFEKICRWLAIVQGRKPTDVRDVIVRLLKEKLVNYAYDDDEDGKLWTLSNSRACKKFRQKVLCKNPDMEIYLQMCDDDYSVSFPREQVLSTSIQKIRVLSLYRCGGLERVDLKYFPKLRSLLIMQCPLLKEVIGWEVVKELGWLEIRGCSLIDFPRVECLPFLREFRFERWKPLERIPVPVFSQCIHLRQLHIPYCTLLAVMDLNMLRFLEVLDLRCCPDLTTIQGLSELDSLTTLCLEFCKALKRVPELGCLKALTHLDMSGSGVKEISGVQELYLLTELRLRWCESLKTLPCLRHLKELILLDIRDTGVEEIPGVEDLVSLERLWCNSSRLNRLPDLHHLPRLQAVDIWGTPLSTMDLSSFYYEKKIEDPYDEISYDISDDDEISDDSSDDDEISDDSSDDDDSSTM